MPESLVGKVIAGRYHILRALGKGDLGDIFHAEDRQLARTVTLEVMSARLMDNSALKSRFFREAQAAGRVTHPNVAAIYDIGEDAETGAVYLSMEFIEGRPLSALLDAGDRVSPERVTNIVSQIAAAFEAARNAGIILGDVKPSRIILAKSASGGDLVKVLKVGISETLTDPTVSTTAAGMIGATPAYMSPEQIEGRELDERSDVFSLGVVTFQMLTGQMPFPGKTPVEILMSRVKGKPRSLAAMHPGIEWGAVMEATVARALETDREKRNVDATHFARDLQNVVTSRAAAPSGVPAGATIVRQLPPEAAPADDDNVQFTVYRPAEVRPSNWYPMLAFAHLAEARPGDLEPDPIARVEREAKRILEQYEGEFKKLVQDASQPIARAGTITFVPQIAGVEFNPPQRSFQWMESIHREEFRLRASPTIDHTTARGSLTVFHGAIIVAEVPLSIRVDSAAASPEEKPPVEPARANPYRKIFASYSRKDYAIVSQIEAFIRGLGDKFLIDVRDIRAGEAWSDRISELIREADVFQLFWSSNSMQSGFVRQEYEYSLSLGRPNFVRPTYWEDPLPETPDKSLPPAELRRLHFQRIPVIATSAMPDGSLTELTRTTSTVERTLAPPPPPAMRRASPPAPVAYKSRSSNTPMIVGGIIVAVIVIAVLFFFAR